VTAHDPDPHCGAAVGDISASHPFVGKVRRTLEDVVIHYQSFLFFINRVRGFPLPLIADEDIAPIVAYMKKAF
jgi:hypothetical protein